MEWQSLKLQLLNSKLPLWGERAKLYKLKKGFSLTRMRVDNRNITNARGFVCGEY